MLTPDDSGGFVVYSSTDRWRPGVTKLKWKNKKSGANVSHGECDSCNKNIC